MTKTEIREAIYNEFVTKYYQSDLCQASDSMAQGLDNFGRTNVEDQVFELLDELADSVIETLEDNEVLKAKKQPA